MSSVTRVPTLTNDFSQYLQWVHEYIIIRKTLKNIQCVIM